jgi:hypothetical protein
LWSSASPATVGQTITFSVKVTSTDGAAVPAGSFDVDGVGNLAAGTVTFMDGTTKLGSTMLDSYGNGRLTVSTLAAGTHSIQAIFAGDGNTLDSMSPILSQTVLPTASEVQVSLNGKFNTTGIYTPGTTFYKKAGLDKRGNAFAANLLGTSITAGGSTFTVRPGEMTNVVSMTGQTVKLPAGSFSGLAFLGAAVNGSQTGTFIIRYSDGSSESITQTMSDWSASATASGETLAKSMDSYVRHNGETVYRTTNVYAYRLALSPGKQAVSITLPNDSDMKLLAMNLVA